VSNHPGKVMIAVPRELAEWLITSCDANLEFGLKSLVLLTTRESQQKMVDLLENNKAIKAATQEALKDV
jgi:hypothetical protein